MSIDVKKEKAVEQALHIKSSYRGSPSSSLGTCGTVERWVSIEKMTIWKKKKKCYANLEKYLK
jgi:hypothetical protein